MPKPYNQDLESLRTEAVSRGLSAYHHSGSAPGDFEGEVQPGWYVLDNSGTAAYDGAQEGEDPYPSELEALRSALEIADKFEL